MDKSTDFALVKMKHFTHKWWEIFNPYKVETYSNGIDNFMIIYFPFSLRAKVKNEEVKLYFIVGKE